MRILRSTIVAATLALAGLATTATAQEHHRTPSPEMKAAFEELHTSMKTFRDTQIVPRLREWKAQYDASLSPADLSALNGLRARATALRKETRDIADRMRKAWHDGRTEEATTLRASLKGQWEKKAALLKELKPIAERSKAKLVEIGTAAQPQIAEWREQGRTIAQQWFDRNRDLLAGNPFPPHAGRMARMNWLMGGEHGKRRAAIRFMLWDGGDLDQSSPNAAQQSDGNDPDID